MLFKRKGINSKLFHPKASAVKLTFLSVKFHGFTKSVEILYIFQVNANYIDMTNVIKFKQKSSITISVSVLINL